MNYKEMWNKLKLKIESDARYHEEGDMQSLSESIWCKVKCKEILDYMKDFEEVYSNTEVNTDDCG